MSKNQKERIEVLQSEFTDYAGRVHKFVIVGVSVCNEERITYDNYVTYIPKALKIGISICNPNDEFDFDKGYNKAYTRAKKSEPALYASKKGYINSKMINAFLEQEAEYLINNPENYIEGYLDAKKRYLRNSEMDNLYNNMSKSEKEIIENSKKDAKVIDKLKSYLTWFNNQKIGNAKGN